MIETTFIDENHETDIKIEFNDNIFSIIDNFSNTHIVIDEITAKFIVNFIKLNIGDI